MKRIDYYKTYYENLSPSNFKVEKQDDKIVISGIENHYPKGFDDKDVKQYKMKQSKIHKYEKGGRTKGLIKKPITTNYQQIRNWIDEYFIDKEHLGEIHHSNKSSTDFGTSWYTIVDINGAFFVEPITIRISDHSTGNRRVLSEIQLSSYTIIKKKYLKY